MSLYAMINAVAQGGTSPNLFLIILVSPLQAMFLHYDVIFLGKTKLAGGLIAFYFGFFITFLGFYFYPKLHKSETKRSGL